MSDTDALYSNLPKGLIEPLLIGIREFMSCQKLSAIDGSTEADGLLSY